jgi:hypothetical protein
LNYKEAAIIMRNSWRQWRDLSWSERTIFVQAMVLLPLASVALRLWRFQLIYKSLKEATSLQEDKAQEESLPEAQRTARMVDAAAHRVPYDATCLRRSLVLWWLLRRHGIDSRLRIGVRREKEGIVAHAWVECQECVLNDLADISQYYEPLL